MKRRVIPKSEKLIKNLKSAKYFREQMTRKLYCFQMDKIGLGYTDDQKVQLGIAASRIREAEHIVDRVFSNIIGEQIIREIE